MSYVKYENYVEQSYSGVLNYEINNKIYCYCLFEFKDEIKKMGFKWDPSIKLWFINKESLTVDIFNKSRKIKNIDYSYSDYRKEPLKTVHYFVYYLDMENIKYLRGDKLLSDKPKRKIMKKLF
jgi:hypothetical protein